MTRKLTLDDAIRIAKERNGFVYLFDILIVKLLYYGNVIKDINGMLLLVTLKIEEYGVANV